VGRQKINDSLYYYRARFYDPKAGRFISEDPIGLAGGDVNFYGYVLGNPVNFIDPLGLFGWPFGNPLGGDMNSPAPVPLPSGNASLGAGGSGMVGPGYGSADSGIAVDTTGNICFYSTICGGGGWNVPAGGELGLVGALGTGQLCTGQETSEGAYWAGGTGLVGQGQVLNNGSITRGLVGVGGGPEGGMAGAGGLSCTTTYQCLY